MSADARNVVVDTNVHFSAWRSRNADSPGKEVVLRGIRKHYSAALSLALLGEIVEKMTEVLGIPSELAIRYVALLRKSGRLYRDAENNIIRCSDPDDAFVFVLAHSSDAWCIVAYDNLFFEPHRRVTEVEFTCMKPVEFLGASGLGWPSRAGRAPATSASPRRRARHRGRRPRPRRRSPHRSRRRTAAPRPGDRSGRSPRRSSRRGCRRPRCSSCSPGNYTLWDTITQV